MKYSIEEIRNFSADADFGGFISEKVALTMLKDLLDKIDRLQEESDRLRRTGFSTHLGEEYGKDLQFWKDRAAQHLADQELLVARERKKVARECCQFARDWFDTICQVTREDCGGKICSDCFVDSYCAKYGVTD